MVARRCLTRLASDQRVSTRNYNQALVLFQYFTSCAAILMTRAITPGSTRSRANRCATPTPPALLVCNFLNSAEYQNRFGMVATHTTARMQLRPHKVYSSDELYLLDCGLIVALLEGKTTLVSRVSIV
jgi:hypothetical protein